jgi:hypothetical protein
VQQRVYVLVFQLPTLLLKSFGKTARRKLWSNYLHDLLSHLADEFERGLPLSLSTERVEQALSKLNKTSTNNNKLDACINRLETCENSQVKERYKKNKVDFQTKFYDTHVWEDLSVDCKENGRQVAALLKLLEKKGRKNQVDWKEVRKPVKGELLSIRFINSPLLKPKGQTIDNNNL